MSSKTKIVVLHRKEVVLSAVFLGFVILIIVLLLAVFGPGKRSGADGTAGNYFVTYATVSSVALALYTTLPASSSTWAWGIVLGNPSST